IRKYEKPRAYRVVALEDVSELQGFYQESLFRLQGVIYERELPPLSNKRVHSSQAPYLRQHIGITGLGLAYMSQAIEHFHQLYAKFERGLASEEIDAWHADQSYKYEGITANSHYFTVGANAAGRQSIPFQDGVDPEGILRRLLGDGTVHTEENSVLYMKATNTGQSKWRYSDLSPSNFSIGDIVEIQFTVMAIRKREGNYKMVIALRSLTLLDDSISLVRSLMSMYTRLDLTFHAFSIFRWPVHPEIKQLHLGQ
ncbi:hypothetical protein K435DRAFT_667775, partial [Dendrothele bispora CBS 962.96]